jgi:hypothetical protein
MFNLKKKERYFDVNLSLKDFFAHYALLSRYPLVDKKEKEAENKINID